MRVDWSLLFIPGGVVFGAILGAAITVRGQRASNREVLRAGAEQRLWDKRAKLYPKLISLLLDDYYPRPHAIQTYSSYERELKDLEQRHKQLHEFRSQVRAFGSQKFRTAFDDYLIKLGTVALPSPMDHGPFRERINTLLPAALRTD